MSASLGVQPIERARAWGGAVILFAWITLPPATAAQAPPPIIKQIDHVMILTQERQRLVALLVDTLQLPIVWGGPGSSFTATTGIALGDVNLELVPRDDATPARLTSLALQPIHLPTVCGDLTKRGFVLNTPLVCEENPGDRRWTVVGFRHPFEGANFFLIQYLAFDMDARRAAFQDTLTSRRGGPLGFWRIREFRLAYAPDQLAAAADNWQRLLGSPTLTRPLRFVFNAGPSIVLTEGGGPSASTLVIEVESLERAATAARSLRLVRAESTDSLVLDSVRLGGLHIVLVRR